MILALDETATRDSAPTLEKGTGRPGADQTTVTALGPPGPEASDARTVLPQFTNYEVIEEVGRGGMGVVYRARQRGAERFVALKVIKDGTDLDAELRTRFATEVRSMAAVPHPNIVQVYEVGEEDGWPFFSMEFAEGGSLAARLKAGPLPVRDAAGLVAVLAGAVEAAHRAGVLHRDLKPVNILLQTKSEISNPKSERKTEEARSDFEFRISDFEPKVTDFGLAKHLEADDGRTPSGAVLGTPSYMAPEQARGAGTVGPAADVYGLGAILYECLTGRPPYQGRTRPETLALLLTTELVPPSQRRRELHPVLEAVCLKCLEKDPTRRYASAQALADDLRCWLRGESTVARPMRWPAKWWRRVRRYRSAAAVALLLLATIVATMILTGRGPRDTGGKKEEKVDPDAALHEIERDLAAGRTVTLIGAKGPPRWHRWHGVTGTVGDSTHGDGVFSFQTIPEANLELLPDPQTSGYRLTAEIRQDIKPNLDSGYVGVYVGYRSHDDDRRTWAYQCLRFWFMDAVAHRPMGPDAAGLSTAHFDDVVAFQPRTGPARSWTIPRGAIRFEAADRPPRPWRKVEVEVRPGGVRAFWYDEQGKRLSVADVPAADYPANTEQMQGILTRKFGDAADGLSLRAFQPRLALGLFAHNSAASFRNVTLEPLAEEP
jgi:serine/threonine-protein kinase